jgi:hypothetical protein
MDRADGGADIHTVHTNINTNHWRGKNPMADDLAVTDDEAAAVAKTENRVTIDSILAKIHREEYIRPIYMKHMTIAVITMQNGYAVVGTATPADPTNFDQKLGKKFAKEDAIRKLWALEGYLLRETLHQVESET